MPDISIFQRDNGFVLTATLKRSGAAIDVSGADEVRFIARSVLDNSLLISAACDLVTDGSDGQVSYTFTADDVRKAGTFNAQFRIKTGSANLTVPNTRYLSMSILKSL